MSSSLAQDDDKKEDRGGRLWERSAGTSASPGSRLMLSRSPQGAHSFGFCAFLRLFVRLRWLAVAGTLAVIVFFQNVVAADLPYLPLYTITAAILGYNVIFHRLGRRYCAGDELEDERTWRANRISALAQINLDLVALFWLLHFSSGLENPCVLFFLFHVVIAGIVLRPRAALIQAGFAALLVLLLGVLEKMRALAHYHPRQILGETELASSWLFVLGLPAIIMVTIFFLSLMTLLIMRERNKSREIVAALAHDLAAKNDKLLRVDKGRKGLLAVASHDLKSPIAAVAGYLMTLKGGYLGEVDPRQLRVLDKCLRRLEGLKDFVSDVLSWTAIESGALNLELRPTQIGELLEEAVARHSDSAARAEIAVTLAVDEPLPDVELTSERMLQVFDNLLGNAIKYTDRGGSVSISARSCDESVRVAIADSGIGMSPEDQARLFEEFFRAAAVKGSYEGTGLGLSLVQGIVRAHRGRIWAESELGVGSTFFVELPLARTGEDKTCGAGEPGR